MNTIVEIIKEFKANIEGLNHPVYARIVKYDDDDDVRYIGELSHYCKQFQEAMTVYYPSTTGSSIDKVEQILLNYLNKFRNIEVVENKSY